MTTSSADGHSWLAALFLGPNLALLDLQIARIRATSRAIKEDHSLDELLDDIEEARVNGVAAMGGSDDA